MEAILTIVGFLGAGKTTLLKHIIDDFSAKGWQPFIVLNDYENAYMDAQRFTKQVEDKTIKALSGSCICCSGIMELREVVNRIPEREKGITLIEANGTSDASTLVEFLGVGLHERFLPPVQIAVVDVKNWQKRGEHNTLEAIQIQVSSLIVLTHLDTVSETRQSKVIKALKALNPYAEISTMKAIDVTLLPKLLPATHTADAFDHLKAHWASCAVDLPHLPDTACIYTICEALPKTILRVKGCTKIGDETHYTYFERKPDGELVIRPFNGIPITGKKLLTIGKGSAPEALDKAIKIGLA